MIHIRHYRWLSILVMGVLVLGIPVALPPHASAAGTMSVDQFVSTYNGRYVDVDGFPADNPYQCVDLFNRYHMDVMGGTYVRMDISGGAKDLWNTTNAQIATLYSKVAASQTAVKGDVAVWSGSMPGTAGYGHVAIVLADKGSTVSTITQNPGATRIGDISKSYLLGYLRPRSLPGAGGGGDGSYVSYQGNVYRIAGGAPIYVSSWSHLGGAQPVTALSDAQFASLRQYPADGTLIAGMAPGHPESGTVYRIAGGAPIYVANYSNIGGDSGTIAVDLTAIHNAGGGDRWSHLRWLPADGTFVSDKDGSVYRFAGGAPIYISNFDHVGGTGGQSVTGVDQVALEQTQPAGLWSHVRQFPQDGTFISDQDGSVYRFAGGAPIYVSNFDHVGGTGGQPVTRVDQVALQRSEPTGTWAHVRSQPLDGTIVTGNKPGDPEHGGHYVFAGGAPIRVSSWANIGGEKPTTVVDLVALRNGGGGGRWSHTRFHPADGTTLDSGTAKFEVRGGVPYVSSTIENGVRIDPVAIRNAGGTGWWSHLAAVPASKSLCLSVRAVRRHSQIRIDVDPNSAANNYRFRIQRRVQGQWRPVMRGRTHGPKDIAVIDLRRGKYRVVLLKQGGLRGTTQTIRLRR